MEASSSSKVTVEYHDPAGIFPLVAKDIHARLPLRNLNWHSPPRPLRQIKSLHVDFVPDKDTQATLRAAVPDAETQGQSSLDIVRSGLDLGKEAVKGTKERRHQIPGLKTSPYLKIYLLRCDDKDGYKESQRKKIREWIRQNVVPEGRREEHDASEWMILHVVIPDTIAASEPRWRESSSKDSDELKERKSGGAKWPGKSTRTVFDRLRADFNDSGKTGHDRVAQIRLTKAQVPPELLPRPAVAPTLEESAQERENAWHDLISKFKTLILGPFDRRVHQYEVDIFEQESRRSLPGWNFCTFFIHKEGLAKALESIGLVEDALAIYDELSLGLETMLRMIASGEAQGTATSFAPYTDDIKDRIISPPAAHTNGTNHDTMTDTPEAAALFSKDYRELIVRSSISIFDFFCYIFTRQKALILRLANTKGARLQLDSTNRQDGGEDLVLASEVCWRASTFIHNVARTLRQDLTNGPVGKESKSSHIDIDSLVCSWTYAVAGKVLEETAVPVFLDVTQFDQKLTPTPKLPNGKTKRPDFSMSLGANQYPQRTTSLGLRKSDDAQALRPPPRPTSGDESSLSPPSSSGADVQKPTGLPGQAELATYRAEIIVMRRKMLEQLAEQRGWHAGWALVNHQRLGKMENVCLDDHADDVSSTTTSGQMSVSTLLSPSLKTALASESSFQDSYEHLTDLAIRHFFAATQSKSAETLIGDLAMLKCERREYEAAAVSFEYVLPLYASGSWGAIQAECLAAYALCLKELQRKLDCIQTLLSLLAKVCAKKMAPDMPRLSAFTKPFQHDDDLIETSGMMTDVVNMSEDLSEDSLQPLTNFFGDVKVHRELMWTDNTDISTLRVTIRHFLKDEFAADSVSVRLVHSEDESQTVCFTSDNQITLHSGLNTIDVHSRSVTSGLFMVDQIIVAAKKLRFVHDVRPKPALTALSISTADRTEETYVAKPSSFVFLYPHREAFHAEIHRSREIHIDKPRHLDVTLRTGQERINSALLRIKPLSAGLRLRLFDAEVNGTVLRKGNETHPGEVALGGLDVGIEATVRVPYTTEHVTKHVAVRFDVEYETSNGTFVFLGSTVLPNELPLDVDVNDIFHLDALFSNFTVRTTSRTPFLVLGADLADSPVFAVHAPPFLPSPLTVFDSQATKLMYKITRKQPSQSGTLKRDAALALTVRYLPIENMVLHSVELKFRRDLEQSDFAQYSRLLVPLLSMRTETLLTEADLELAALMNEAVVPSPEAIGWREITDILAVHVQQSFQDWLQQWHTDNVTVPLERDRTAEAITEQITISVDVPNIDMIFEASLELLDAQRPLTDEGPVLTLGQPVKAILRIKHTSNWSAKSIFPNVPVLNVQGEEQAGPAYVCDVGTESDSWIIGGQRRAHFTPAEGVEHTFSLLLIPIRLGSHLLPHVEVQLETPDPEAESMHPDGPLQTCETHYETAGQVVQVIRDVRTARIQLAESFGGLTLPTSRPGTASTKDAG